MDQIWFIVIGAFLSVLFGVFLADPLKKFFAPLLAKLGQRETGINGIWEATFEYPTSKGIELYPEIIELRTFLGQITGKIIPHEKNHPRLLDVAPQKPLRVRGELRDNQFFTGTWLHPLDRQQYHGAFHLLAEMTGNKMEGIWIGYSDKHNIIQQGKWIWKRLN